MPTQTGSSAWACDFCGAHGFRSFDQVRAHEAECRQGQLGAPAPARGPASFIMPPSETNRYASHSSPPQAQNSPRSRRFRIIVPGEGWTYQMADSDVVACQSLELFEATHQNVKDYESANNTGESISLGQVGIRCINCLPGNEYSTYYPDSVGDIATCIQMLSDRHISLCPGAPGAVRGTCEQAAVKRRRDHDHRRPPSQEEERQHVAFVEHCRHFSSSVGLVDKYPPKSGIAIRDTPVHRTGDPQGQPTRPVDYNPPPMRAPMASLSQLPPILPSGPIMDHIEATPLARRNKTGGSDQGYPMPPGRQEYMPPASGDRQDFPHSERERFPAFTPQPGYRGPYPSEGLPERTPAAARRPEDSSTAPHQPYPPPPKETPRGYQPFMAPQGRFPYYQESDGTWHCIYCSSLHLTYRDPGSIWSAPDYSPPPPGFVDQHLCICRPYLSQIPPPGYYDGPPLTGYSFGTPGAQYGYPPTPSGWGPPSGPSYPPQDGPFYPPAMDYPPYHPSEGELPPRTARARPPPRTGGPRVVIASDSTDHEMMKAVDVLVASDLRHFGTDPKEREERGQLVLEEDKLLLTQYFYHLMRQLRLCRFSESDRKTRGGKRENIKVGYGGLQCVHCSDATNARKFFWSNVDRLANSFAEIPAHVLKCRRCPVPVKTALMELKKRHAEQMARLPRGSQKVFFRRMWRRLHDEDPEDDPGEATDAAEEAPVPDEVAADEDSPGQLSEETNVVVLRSTEEAAKALAESSNSPPSPSSRIPLAIADDKEWLSDMDCFIRRNLEVFCATEEDVEIAREDRKYPVSVGQVGIRCIHCSIAAGAAARGPAVAYPYSINGIYESVREFQRLHLEVCPHLPDDVKKDLSTFKGSASLSSVLRKYYVLAAKALGIKDTPDGIRSGGESVPLGSSAVSVFASPDGRGVLEGATVTPLESRKRKMAPTSNEESTETETTTARPTEKPNKEVDAPAAVLTEMASV